MSTTAELWHEFSAPLRTFILRRVRDEHVADDLLQEVFLRVHRKLSGLADEERLTAWLYRIARNVIIDHHRRRSHRELEDAELLEDQLGDEVETRRELGECVSQLVSHLPADYRQAVEWDELHDIPQQEIARRIGLSVSGAKSRIQRGRRLLKSMLLDCCQVEFDRSGNVIDYDVIADQGDCCADRETTSDCQQTDA